MQDELSLYSRGGAMRPGVIIMVAIEGDAPRDFTVLPGIEHREFNRLQDEARMVLERMYPYAITRLARTIESSGEACSTTAVFLPGLDLR